ncbi:hypothetical protein PhCBS80983_g00439 [Powellomyces hirtus]|uniref:Pentacotripeptide-repeat region of PRORP domain-containing protein n=1 Tax=Powellomyces hirtus TaxID=109895 RepID=A0A507EF87_9FUNG|nr:hypothetical protein PhCBS80983_g00439 [Powellomyces hirtus]
MNCYLARSAGALKNPLARSTLLSTSALARPLTYSPTTTAAFSLQCRKQQFHFSKRSMTTITTPIKSDDIAESLNSTDALMVPPGVTAECHKLFTELTDALNSARAQPEDLRLLSYSIETPEDAELFKSALKRWRHAGQHQEVTDNVLFLDTLFRVGAYDTILDMLCDRPAYRILPAVQHIEMLFIAFKERLTHEREETKIIEGLDNLFRTFAVALYTDISPTEGMYNQLVLACLESRTAEGYRRADFTLKEMASLGYGRNGAIKQALESYNSVSAV